MNECTATAVRDTGEPLPDGGLRYTSRQGSECLAFGLNMAGEHFGTLWLSEGEFNCLAIWQSLKVYGWRHRVNWDVVSFGSEARALSPLVVGRARQYQQVIAWCDRPEVTARALAEIPGAWGLRSPLHGGVKLDAAELARRGLLGEFIERAEERLEADPVRLERLRALVEGAE